MTSNFSNYVTYIIAPPRKGAAAANISDKVIADQEASVRSFLSTKENASLKATFIEYGEVRRNKNNWPELIAAIEYCKANKCHLVFAEFGSLANNAVVSNLVNKFLYKDAINPYLSIFIPNIFCIDQPYINRDNFKIIVEHAQQQKRMHGDLIKAGLSKTSAKSGNPNALDVINKVNKPKIDNAIIFALLLQPVIAEYKKQNLSQRKMVARLNEENFKAPEGGTWVLSQLQKVLERIAFNEKALELAADFKLYATKNYNENQILNTLIENKIEPPRAKAWDLKLVQAVKQRIEALKEIDDFNNFVISAVPIIKKYRLEEIDAQMLHDELEQEGMISSEVKDRTTTI